MNQYQGAKKIIFTACHLGKVKLAFTSPDFISISPKSFLMSRIYFTVLLLFEFLKKHHLPIGQVKNRIHQPDSKIHQPWAIGHYFLCTLQYISKSYTMSKNTIDRQHTERGQLQCQLLLQFIASFNAPSQSPQAQYQSFSCPTLSLCRYNVHVTCIDRKLHIILEPKSPYQSPDCPTLSLCSNCYLQKATHHNRNHKPNISYPCHTLSYPISLTGTCTRILKRAT